MKKIFLLFNILFTSISLAQFSKTHYIPPISCAASQVPTNGQAMYISCPSTTPVNFRIISLGGNIINGTVSRDNPYVLTIGNSGDTQIMANQNIVNTILTNKGYIVEANDLVYVSVRIAAPFHAGSIVSKGLAALGTNFRIGGFLNKEATNYSNNHYTFASILATENNTIVSFNNIKPGVVLVNDGASGNTPASVTLNSGESYVIAVQGPTEANRDGLIGALISSDKPIAVNCGSVAGTNSASPNLDFGLDQIVSAERTGQEYILIKGLGNSFDVIEKTIVIANEDGTEIFINGSLAPVATIQAGEYFALNGENFTPERNLYIKTSKNTFVYQAIGGSNTGTNNDQANQNMHFVPPLSCATPKVVNNIPLINQVASSSNFFGTVMVVTETGATLSFIINGVNYAANALPSGVSLVGPNIVTGNTSYETYSLNGLTGNISVISIKQVYVSYFGSSGAATYGGFYSGFTFKPEISQDALTIGQLNCIPTTKLTTSTIAAFDDFQWFFNDVAIPGATSKDYTPTQPGYYNVRATILACNSTLISDKIPVSSCVSDTDADLVNENVDIDRDNDGLTNCTESFGNQNIDSSISAGTIPSSNTTYSIATTNSLPASLTPFAGNTNGTLVTEVLAGKGYNVVFTTTFSSPTNVSLTYPATALASDLLNADAEYIVNSDINKTVTITNPTNQLLIDTNYDGIYESGVTQFSSFEVRFRLNSTTPLVPGSATFRFDSSQTNTFKFTHKNLSDTTNNRVTFILQATCVPKDTDNDGIPDQDDLDSDNDGITDLIENLGANFVVIPFVDVNKDGLNDAYASRIPLDTDLDGLLNVIDLDADNDGIFDLVESGSNAVDINNNGIVDGNLASFGANGLSNALETNPDSNNINYTVANNDTDALQNFIDLDADNDNCFDVFEVGYADENSDGILGNAPVTVNDKGIVTSSAGYTVLTPLQRNNYVLSAPIIITTQPANTSGCEVGSTTFSVVTNGVTTHQWQLSTDGGATFNQIANAAPYSGANTANLLISNVTTSMNNYIYRVFLTKTGNACNLTSAQATFTVLPRPTVAPQITIVQCDTDLDLIANFNLTQKNNDISTAAASQTFTYFTTEAGAIADNASSRIANPIVYNSPTLRSVWARIVNANGCFNISKINLLISATTLPGTFSRTFAVCDDFIDNANNDYDGIAKFNFSSVENAVLSALPTSTGFTINYYRNLADFNSELNPISKNINDPVSIYNYRNIGSPNAQTIYIRVESTLTNACFGDGKIFLIVEKLPVANPVTIPRQCDTNPSDAIIQSAFNTATIQSKILNGQSLANVSVSYFDQNNNPLSSPLPNPFVTTSQVVRARVTNNAGNDPNGKCFYETNIQFVVDKSPFANTVNITPACDRIIGDASVDFEFDTSNITSTLLGAQNPAEFVVTYFAQNGNPLPNPLPNPFLTTTQRVKAVLTNPINPVCKSETLIQFTVSARPVLASRTESFFCDGTSAPQPIDAGLVTGNRNDFNYQWSKDGTVLAGEINYTYIVNRSGIYTVEVSNKLTGCSAIREHRIIFSQSATITNVSVEDLYNDEKNMVTITVTGAGNYEFSIDEPLGPFQASNVFPNIRSGIRTVYVNDKNGCTIVAKEIAVIGVMKFFTPNGDGYNDFWKISGVTNAFNKKSEVFIFDRFGKLLRQIQNGADQGWDGTYNGQPLPADDYWYSLVLEDGRTLKGHFTLKR